MRVAFVGAGAIARRHCDILRKRPDVAIAAVCDVDRRRAGTFARDIGARVHESWEVMLETEHIDAVFVCTPPALHVDPAVASLERGLAVYLEKPLARSLADGRRIVAAWEASAAVCAVGYQWRSLDLVRELRELLRGAAPGMLVSRSFGPTESGRGDRRAAAGAGGASWFVDPGRSGGILFELGSHDIDLQLALAGPVESVQASASTGHLALAGTETELHDAVALTLRFAGGGLGSVLVAWTEAQEPAVTRWTCSLRTSRCTSTSTPTSACTARRTARPSRSLRLWTRASRRSPASWTRCATATATALRAPPEMRSAPSRWRSRARSRLRPEAR